MLAALLTGETTGALAALLAVLVASNGASRVASWLTPTTLGSLLRATK